MTWRDDLVALGACDEAMVFAQDYDTPQAVWDACPVSEWMIWWYERSPYDTLTLLRAYAAHANLERPLIVEPAELLVLRAMINADIDASENNTPVPHTIESIQEQRIVARDAVAVLLDAPMRDNLYAFASARQAYQTASVAAVRAVLPSPPVSA